MSTFNVRSNCIALLLKWNQICITIYLKIQNFQQSQSFFFLMNNNQFVLRFNNNLLISFSRHFHFIPDRILASVPGESTIILIYKQLYTIPCDVNFWDLIEKMKDYFLGYVRIWISLLFIFFLVMDSWVTTCI